MREIKFRAWNKKRKKMYEVLHLHFESFEGIWATVKGYSIIEQKDIHIQIQPKNIELMQYTGLKDKNGKDIYEGDYLKSEQAIYEVKYEYGAFIGEIKKAIQNIGGLYTTNLLQVLINLSRGIDQVEVIGNIYENPELLEVKNAKA